MHAKSSRCCRKKNVKTRQFDFFISDIFVHVAHIGCHFRKQFYKDAHRDRPIDTRRQDLKKSL